MASFATVGIVGQANVGSVLNALQVVRRQITFLSGAQANLATSSRGVRGATQSFLNTLTAIPQIVGAVFQGVRRLGQNIRGLGNELAAIGFRLSFLVSLPVSSFFSGVVTAAAGFETTLTKIVNLTDASAASVNAWRQDLLDMAVSLGRTPNALAEGLFAVTSAGLTGAEAMEVLENSAKASAIGLGEMEIVARAVTGILGAYAGTGLTATQATEQLVAVVDQGNIEAEALAPTLGRVSALAAEMGVSFSQAGAFIAAFTRSGVPAEVAVTSLRAALSSMLKPTEAAKEQLAQFGITADEVRESIATNGLDRTLIALTAAFGDNDEAMAKVIGTARGLAGVLFVTGGIAQDYLTIQNNIANSAGILEEGFRRLQNTTAFQWEQTKAGLEVVGITIGNIVLPAVNQFLQAMLPLIAAVKQFAELHPELILLATAFALVAASMSPILIITGLLISSVGTIISTLAGFGVVLTGLISPIGAVAIAIGTLAALFVNSARDIANKAGVQFDNLGQRARGWGRNIVIQIARGIAEATIAVVQALIRLGQIIASWLAPGSPPRLLPDLPKWGAAWMTEILRGFTNADFSVFNEVASLVERFLRSLGTDALPETSLVPAIMSARDAIALAVVEMEQYGSVTEATMDLISQHFGAAAGDIEAYVGTLAELKAANEAVAEAQENLNEVQERYSELLAPLNDELDSIREKREDIADQMRIDELNAIIATATANEDWLAVTLAQMELREIALEDEVDAIEQQEDAAVDAAEAELEAAQAAQAALEEQAARQLALIDAQIENNNLLREHIDLLKQLAEQEESGGMGGAGDLPDIEGGGLGGFLPPLTDPDFDLGLGELLAEQINGAIEQATGPINSLKEKFNSALEEIKGFFAPLVGKGGLLDQLSEVWARVFLEIPNRIDATKNSINDWYHKTVKPIFDMAGKAIKDFSDDWVIPALNDVRDWLNPIVTEAMKVMEQVIREDIIPALLDMKRELEEVALATGNFWLELSKSESAPGSWDEMKTAVGTALDSIEDRIGLFIFNLTHWFVNTDYGKMWTASLRLVVAAFQAAFDTIKEMIEEDLLAPFRNAQDTIKVAWDTVARTIVGILFWLIGQAVIILTGISAIVTTFALTIISGLVGGITETLQWLRKAGDFILDGIEVFITGIINVLAGIIVIIKGIMLAFFGALIFIFGSSSAVLEESWVTIKEGVRTLFQGIVEIFVGGLGAILGVLAFGLGAAISFVAGFVDGVITFFQKLFDRLVGHSIVPEMIKAIANEFAVSLPNAVFAALVGFVDGVIERFDKLKTSVVSKIGEMVDEASTALTSWFDATKDAFYNAGKDFIQRMIDGINELIDDLRRAASSASDLLDGLTGGGGGGMGSGPGTGSPPPASGSSGGPSGPTPTQTVNAPAFMAPVSAPVMSSSTLSMNMTVNTPMDVAVMESVIRRVFRDEWG